MMDFNPECIKLLAALGRQIEELVTDEHYDAAASFWPQSMSIEQVIHFALNCAEHGTPILEDE